MRISDWSSDVCSSDLLGELERREPALLLDQHAPGEWQDAAEARQADPQEGEEQQIGRASCRERVVSVRVDLGGRRIIKQKKNGKSKTYNVTTKRRNKHR